MTWPKRPPRGGAFLGVLFLLVLVSSCGAGLATLSRAPGGEASVDAWDESLRVAASVLVVPAAFAIGSRLGRRTGRRLWFGLPLVASLVPLLYAIWTVSIAGIPTGRGREETASEGRRALEIQFSEALNAVASGRIEVVTSDRYSCSNDFGRHRGAAQSAVHGYIRPSLLPEEFDELVDRLRGKGWRISPSKRREEILTGDGEIFRFPTESFDAARKGYSIVVFDLRTADGFVLRTPCLRSDE